MALNKIHQVKALVAQNGGWDSVYAAYGALRDATERGTRQQPCPKTGDGRTKFRFFKDWSETGGGYHNDFGAMPDGIEMLSWFNDMPKGEVLDDIISILGGDIRVVKASTVKKVTTQQSSPISPDVAAKRKAIIKRIWDGSQPIEGTLAETYLRSRGIKGDLSLVGNNLRFHPALSYKEDDSSPWQKLPGMLAIYRDKDGVPLTLHRTFLKPDGSGKADVSRPKMILAPPRDMRGGYIMLDKPIATEAGKYIGIAEGIETALSVREATGCPMWVGYSDRLMEMVNIPLDVKMVFPWIDLEPSGAGERAGNVLTERLAKQSCESFPQLPPSMGRSKVDWNDVYVEMGSEGFEIIFNPEISTQTGVEINV